MRISPGLAAYLIRTHILFLLSTILTHACSSLVYYLTLPGFLYPYHNLIRALTMIYTFRRYFGPPHPHFLFYLGAFNVPIFLCVILDSTVGAEFTHLFILLDTSERQYNRFGLTHLSSRPDALLDPFSTIVVSFVYHVQRLDVCRTDRHQYMRN